MSCFTEHFDEYDEYADNDSEVYDTLKDNIYIYDNSDIPISQLFNISNFKKETFNDRVIKLFRMNKSSFTLKPNIPQNNLLSIRFVFSLMDVNKNQLILKRNNDIRVEIMNNHIYVSYGSESKKMNTILTVDKLYHFILAIDDTNNTLKIYLDDELLEINNTTSNVQIENNKYTFQLGGQINATNMVYNGMNGYLGFINIYDTMISYSDFFETQTQEVKQITRDFKLCKFIPKGNTKNKCESLCQKMDNCGKEYCQKICDECTDFNKCEWLPKPTQPPVISPPEPDVPLPPKIKCFPGNNKIEVRFKKPNDNYSPIRQYLITSKKSYNNNGYVKLSTIDDKDCGETSCRFVLSGLDNEDFYDINVKAINSVGMSNYSNTETIAPNGEKQPREVSSALLETDDEIKQQVLNDFNYDNSNCDSQAFPNYDEHVLDSIDNNYNFSKFVNELFVKK